MAGSVNKVTLLGRLGADPEVKTLNNGNKIANLRVATSDTWKDKNTGEKKERTEWTRVTIFNEGLAGIAEKYLKKGSQVYIEGALQTRKWQDQDGKDRFSTEVVLQGFKGELTLIGGNPNGGGYQQQNSNETAVGYGGGKSAADDDTIPF